MKNKNLNSKQKSSQVEMFDKICKRAHYLTTQMIWNANHRPDAIKGDPKVGGHPAACASALHITGALHLLVKSGFDYIANKPHAAPVDHAYNFLLDLLLDSNGERLSPELAIRAMNNLRCFPKVEGEPMFQSYHSPYDPDHHGFLPSGTVGIPPVNIGYLALAYRFAREHGHEVPDAHFWSILGDSEFREGSVYEAIPDFAERELGNMTWIIDYNRQSLDGHRITNRRIMQGTDAERIERTMLANGWAVTQLRHGPLRRKLFTLKEGEAFKEWLESGLEDYELQALLLVQDAAALRKDILRKHSQLKSFLKDVDDGELLHAMRDFAGHDIMTLADAMLESKKNPHQPHMIIAHTLKGWGLKSAAAAGNHSSLPSEEEVHALREAQGLSVDQPFVRFSESSEEGQFLRERGEKLFNEIKKEKDIREKHQKDFQAKLAAVSADTVEGFPQSFSINTKLASYPHTQWMLGQCTAKLTRIANSKDLSNPEEKAWKPAAELLVSMAPDVGTSTNLNPAMDGKIFGVAVVPDFETDFGVKDKKTPDLVPGEEKSDRFLRFEIAEGNVMSCLGSYGRIRDMLGIPILPLMTVYDFFIKRALDQLFYNLYWKSSFILVGTPAGVTLSPEGAQHGWKSDIQIPNQITWEPFFCQELDWILADAIRRHFQNDNVGRTGVIIRGVTRGIEQKQFLQRLQKQKRFESAAEDAIWTQVREDVLAGAYYLVDYRGFEGYEPGENVVHIFAMGSVTTEALKASDQLLERGIYANVIVVTSSDLLAGVQADQDDYQLLRDRLGISGDLYLVPSRGADATAESIEQANNAYDVKLWSGRRVPIVSVHDGEPGLLDNLGSIVGVKQIACAVRKHSRSGTPADVYKYHHIDADSVVEACGKALSETALENVRLSGDVTEALTQRVDWHELWPPLANS